MWATASASATVYSDMSELKYIIIIIILLVSDHKGPLNKERHMIFISDDIPFYGFKSSFRLKH